MKRIGMIIAAAMCVAVPAVASANDFTGPRVGANIGVSGDEVFTDDNFAYGVNAGYDVKVVGPLRAGVTVEYGNAEDGGRDLSATVRVGSKVSKNTLVYGLAGYTNQGKHRGTFTRDRDGVRLGGGLEYNLGAGFYGNVEYRYSNYDATVAGRRVIFGDDEKHNVFAGIGLRF